MPRARPMPKCPCGLQTRNRQRVREGVRRRPCRTRPHRCRRVPPARTAAASRNDAGATPRRKALDGGSGTDRPAERGARRVGRIGRKHLGSSRPDEVAVGRPCAHRAADLLQSGRARCGRRSGRTGRADHRLCVLLCNRRQRPQADGNARRYEAGRDAERTWPPRRADSGRPATDAPRSSDVASDSKPSRPSRSRRRQHVVVVKRRRHRRTGSGHGMAALAGRSRRPGPGAAADPAARPPRHCTAVRCGKVRPGARARGRRPSVEGG